jgi:hypothetical protein
MTKTSDAPCRAPIPPGRAEIPRGARTASTAFASTKTAFPARSAFDIDMCSAHIRRQRPPPISRLCRRDPASGARSPRRCSRTEGLDSRRLRGLIARGREDHAPHADVCNQYDRRAQPPDRPNPAHRARGRPQAQLHRTPSDGFRRLPPPAERVAAPLSKHSQPRRHGSGSTGQDVNPSLCLSTTIARRGRFLNPTRSARTPPVASTLRRRHGDTHAGEALETRASASSPGDSSAFAEPPPCRAASRIPSRKGTRSAAPEVPFVTGSPRRASLVRSPAVSSLATL